MSTQQSKQVGEKRNALEGTSTPPTKLPKVAEVSNETPREPETITLSSTPVTAQYSTTDELDAFFVSENWKNFNSENTHTLLLGKLNLEGFPLPPQTIGENSPARIIWLYFFWFAQNKYDPLEPTQTKNWATTLQIIHNNAIDGN